MNEIKKLQDKIRELESTIDSLDIENRRLNDYISLKNTRNAGRKGFPKDIIKKIKELHKNGLKAKEIKNELKNNEIVISTSTINRILRTKPEKIKEEDIDYAEKTLIEMFDEISQSVFELDSPIPKNYEDLLKKNFDGWNKSFEEIVRLVSLRYITLEDFIKKNEIIIQEPLSHFFNFID